MSQFGKGKANAKIILSGDYAVLFGEPAIAAGLERGTTIHIEVASAWSFELDGYIPSSGVNKSLLKKACRAMADEVNANEAFSVHIDNEVPVGAGLGASAAFCLAFARALDDAGFHNGSMFRIAARGEKMLHGYASAIDLEAAYHRYRFVFHPRYKNPQIDRLDGEAMTMLLTWVGPGSETEKMYRRLQTLRDNHPRIASHIDQSSGLISEKMSSRIESAEHKRVGELMTMEHGMLDAFGLVGPEADRAAHIARRAGALGAKMTGAGGDGAVIALVANREDEVRQRWEGEGWTVLRTEL
jgi:mevalonate kinase